jgi:hypothetical protein
MTTPVITLYPDILPAKGQANDAFDANVNSFLNWLTLTNGPELQGLVVYTNDVANTVLATALAGNLPPLTGKSGNYIRANAAENGGEFRTPVQVASDIGFGPSASPTLTNLTLTGGVFIGGTGVSNKLDDYEEGTWTPGLGSGIASSGNFGKYTKVGDTVFIEGSITVGTTSNTSDMLVNGFPFLASATTRGGFAIRFTNFNTSVFSVHMNFSDTTFSLYTNAGVLVTYANFSTKRIDFVGHYTTNL